jgi:hypothetical protein
MFQFQTSVAIIVLSPAVVPNTTITHTASVTTIFLIYARRHSRNVLTASAEKPALPDLMTALLVLTLSLLPRSVDQENRSKLSAGSIQAKIFPNFGVDGISLQTEHNDIEKILEIFKVEEQYILAVLLARRVSNAPCVIHSHALTTKKRRCANEARSDSPQCMRVLLRVCPQQSLERQSQ